MKTIKILIAASEEMHEEKLEFSNLIEHLNEVLEPRGIELKRVKWNPENDCTLEDFKTKLNDCEMCLTLYWNELAGKSEEELNMAYQQLRNGSNPRKLYVFFKDPTEEISDALKDFKANFVTNYGHFFCKFKNVDTMNLHFILQFEAYQNHIQDLQDKLIKVKEGKVMVGDKQFVDLDQIPFVALNKEYAQLQRELADLDLQIAEARVCHRAAPNNEELENNLFSLCSLRKKKADEFEEHQQHLYSLALQFARLDGNQCSERIRKARELFEAGDAIGADGILNMEEMKCEAERRLKQYEQNRNNLEQTIEEFRLKADTVMANTLKPIPERFSTASNAYEKAIAIARMIHYDSEKMAELLFGYACLLKKFNHMYEALEILSETLGICRKLAAYGSETSESYLAKTLNNLAILEQGIQHYVEAEHNYSESLEIRQRLAISNPDEYELSVAHTLNNLATLQSGLQRFDDAKNNYTLAIDIYRRFAVDHPELYETYLANSLGNLADLQCKQKQFVEAEKNYICSLEIFQRYANNNPDVYNPYIAETLRDFAIMQTDLERFDEAERNYNEVLKIYLRLADNNPEEYDCNVADTYNCIGILQYNLLRYDEAERNCTKALTIYRRLAVVVPEAYKPYVAEALNNLALIQNDQQRFDEAEQSFIEALEIRRYYVTVNPDAHEIELAKILNNMALFYNDIEKEDQCFTYLYEALDIYHRFNQRNAGLYDDDINKIIEFIKWKKQKYNGFFL